MVTENHDEIKFVEDPLRLKGHIYRCINLDCPVDIFVNTICGTCKICDEIGETYLPILTDLTEWTICYYCEEPIKPGLLIECPTNFGLSDSPCKPVESFHYCMVCNINMEKGLLKNDRCPANNRRGLCPKLE